MLETLPLDSKTQEPSFVQCADSVWEWTNCVRAPLFWRGYVAADGLRIVGLSLDQGVYVVECIKCETKRALSERSILKSMTSGNSSKCEVCHIYTPKKKRKPQSPIGHVCSKKPLPVAKAKAAPVVESPSVAINDSDAAFAAAMLDPANSIYIDSSPDAKPQKDPMPSDNYFKVTSLINPAFRKIDQRTGKLEQTTWFFHFRTGDQLSQDKAYADANEQAHELLMRKHVSQTAVFKPARGLSLPIVGDL